MVTVCDLLKSLLFHFPGSREDCALSGPLVRPGLPKSGSAWAMGHASQPGPHPQSLGYSDSVRSPYRAIYQKQGMLRPEDPLEIKCHPERLGHVPEDTRLLRGRARPPAFGSWSYALSTVLQTLVAWL